MKIQFRIYPKFSLGDIDIFKTNKLLSDIEGVKGITISDDRAYDAVFITVLVDIDKPALSVLKRIRKAFLNLRRVTPFVVDAHGNDTPLDSLDAKEIPKYGRFHDDKT